MNNNEPQFILCLYLEFAMFHECLVNGSLIANCNLLWEKLIIIPTLLPVQCSVKGYLKVHYIQYKRQYSKTVFNLHS